MGDAPFVPDGSAPSFEPLGDNEALILWLHRDGPPQLVRVYLDVARAKADWELTQANDIAGDWRFTRVPKIGRY